MLMFSLSPLFAAAPAILRVLLPAGGHSPVPATFMPLRHSEKVWQQMPLPYPLAACAQAFARLPAAGARRSRALKDREEPTEVCRPALPYLVIPRCSAAASISVS